MKVKMHQVNTVPDAPEPGGIYFETSTGRILVAQEDGGCTEYGGGSSVQPSPNDVVIDISLIQETTSTVEEEPELVTLLKKYVQAANSGESVVPKLFVKETKNSNGTPTSFLYPASFNGNVVEVEGQTAIYPGMLSYTSMSPDSGTFNVATTFATIVYVTNTFAIMGIKTIAMSESGSANKVLAENGSWVNLPSMPTVDAALSETSTNPVQNKAVTAALEEKQGKFVHGGTLQVPSINGSTALSAGSVDANADYVEVQYTGSSDASFDFNSKFSANWFKDRQDKPQRMLLRNNSSSTTLTVTTSPNGNFSYDFVKVTLPAGAYAEFLVYKSIVAATASKSGRNPEEGGVVETGHEVVKTDGDGTKFLNDAGQYTAIPQQERGTVVFFSSEILGSVTGKGMAVRKSSLKPTGITPIVGKDIVIQVTVGVIGLITSSDLQNYYLSYDNGTLLQEILNS